MDECYFLTELICVQNVSSCHVLIEGNLISLNANNSSKSESFFKQKTIIFEGKKIFGYLDVYIKDPFELDELFSESVINSFDLSNIKVVRDKRMSKYDQQ